jgi:anthranilate phosphoribosyltransferase
MSIAPYLKEVARGKAGARALPRDQAAALMSAVLRGEATDHEVGAFCIAMRVKGETADELAGFVDAVHALRPGLHTPAGASSAPVVISSYNGARKLPNLVPLLALLLAQEGVPVLVHGVSSDPTRVTTQTLFETLGLPVARTEGEVADAFASREPVFMPIAHLSPELARLLDLRRVLGVRNSAHSVAKLLQPLAQRALRVASYTHPEFASSMSDCLALTHADALLLRGTEGEAVADPRRPPRMDGFVGGHRYLAMPAHEGVVTELPLLPSRDAVATARFIQSVVSGEKPCPRAIEAQVAAVLDALQRMGQSAVAGGLTALPPSPELAHG